jgi:hypothetical protein
MFPFRGFTSWVWGNSHRRDPAPPAPLCPVSLYDQRQLLYFQVLARMAPGSWTAAVPDFRKKKAFSTLSTALKPPGNDRCLTLSALFVAAHFQV